jgi:hypothetical protein
MVTQPSTDSWESGDWVKARFSVDGLFDLWLALPVIHEVSDTPQTAAWRAYLEALLDERELPHMHTRHTQCSALEDVVGQLVDDGMPPEEILAMYRLIYGIGGAE